MCGSSACVRQIPRAGVVALSEEILDGMDDGAGRTPFDLWIRFQEFQQDADSNDPLGMKGDFLRESVHLIWIMQRPVQQPLEILANGDDGSVVHAFPSQVAPR